MFVCEQLQFRKWSPDFSGAGLSNPGAWTRVLCAGVELCNSLEEVEWLRNPVQTQLCEACGTPGCASGGYVHVSRLGELLLWSAPQVEEDREPLWALQKLGAIAFSEATWPGPSFASFPRANNRALADAWALGPGRPRDLHGLVPMLRGKLVGGDTLETDEAIAIVDRLLGSLLAQPEAPCDVRIVGASKIETLYFDGPAGEDWPALAFVDGAPHIALNRDLVAL